MSNYIMPLNQYHQPYVEQKILSEEPWHIIASEALLEYGIGTYEHQWYGEFNQNILMGVMYHYKGLIHFIYEEAPPINSPIYSFITTYFPNFITHGKSEIVRPIVQRLGQYQAILNEECSFVLETPETKSVANLSLPWPESLTIRYATVHDLPNLFILFKNSPIESQVDSTLITEIIYKQRVLVAFHNHQLAGCIMALKEARQYSLIGDLFVEPKQRKLGIASLLGQCMIQEQIKKRKKICFYYSNSDLQEFYSKAFFAPIGTWISYQLFRMR